MFHRTDFSGFLVCCLIAIQQLNGVEKKFVAISLMLNHNLTGLHLLDRFNWREYNYLTCLTRIAF